MNTGENDIKANPFRLTMLPKNAPPLGATWIKSKKNMMGNLKVLFDHLPPATEGNYQQNSWCLPFSAFPSHHRATKEITVISFIGREPLGRR